MRNEPAITIGAITAAVGAVLALLVAFGLNLSEAQTGAIIAVVVALGPLVSAIITRSQVTPVANIGSDYDPEAGA